MIAVDHAQFSTFFSGWPDSRTMNDGEALVGVVGERPAALDAAVAELGVRTRAGAVETVLDAEPDLIAAVGDAALFDVARATPDVPVLPVATSRGFRPVAAEAVGDALGHALAGDPSVQSHSILDVEYDGSRVARALADVSLLTDEVAHISEYAVAADGDRVSRFRADGVVVATPAGSAGYARRIDCPVVAPGTGVGPVAPIAPFATDPDHWVLPLDDVRLTVERDETPITLVADDREVATVASGEPVRIGRGGTVDLVVAPQSDSQF